jgi:S-adenosylmethionine hydrolase
VEDLSRRIVGILTDYGVADTYVGELKAALLSGNPDLALVDITHMVSPFNVLEGAFLLYLSYRHFPEGSIFLAIVDPGVGTSRRGVALRTSRYWFVAPDNGVAYPAAAEDGIRVAYMIDQTMFKTYGGSTFHGRDVFAPVAAMISKNSLEALVEVKPESLVKLELPQPRVTRDAAEATVIHIDRFGNVVLNISRKSYGPLIDEMMGRRVELRLGRRKFAARLVEAYGDERRGCVVALWGGTGFLEISVVEGSFVERSQAKVGDRVLVKWF